MPIDLPTTLRLVSASNPTIAMARARVAEAYQRLEQANVLWLPNLTVGTTYTRHDGQTQNQRGEVFTVSRSSLFGGGGAVARFDASDALFTPLVARRLTDAEAARAQMVNQNIQLDAALAYFDLVSIYGQIAINADTLARAEQMLDRAEAAHKAGLSKTAADINRALTEVNLRRQDAIVLRGQAAAASARLVRLLLLDPSTELVPADGTVLPIVVVPADCPLDSLVTLGLVQRPEVAMTQALTDAGEIRVRQARVAPLLPKVQVDYISGAFGGGQNSYIGDTGARGDGVASVYWELRNLGFGNAAQVRERQAVVDQARYRQQEVNAQVAAEITEAAKLAGARFQSLDSAQKAVANAIEMYRKLLDTSFGMIGPRPQYDPLEPLLAIQALNQARLQYLAEVVEFNRSQFRLYTAVGQPSIDALPTLAVSPLAVPVVPAPAPPKK